jgi:tetratricopeptide (TPR) repeat protein
MHFEESLRIARELNDPEHCVAALNNLALLEHASLNYGQAIELGREALDLAVLQGDRHREAALHSNLADFLQALGQSDAALRHLRASAVIYGEIGVVAGEHQAEIWKLFEW